MRGGGYDSGKKHGAAEMALDILNKISTNHRTWLANNRLERVVRKRQQLPFYFANSLQPLDMTKRLPLPAEVPPWLAWIYCALEVVGP